MINEKRTNPVVSRNLRFYIEQKSWEDMETYLLSLSNADFRSVGYILSEDILLKYKDEEFWELFTRLSLFKPKAFLGTCLKASAVQYCSGNISVNSKWLNEYAISVVDKQMAIDRDKFLASFIGILREDNEFNTLFTIFKVKQGKERIRYLLRSETPPAYFVLFKNLKHLQDDMEFLEKCCYALIKKQDRLSFNLVSIICKYFGLTNIRGTFSLNIEPFQLNYLDVSQQSFVNVLTSV